MARLLIDVDALCKLAHWNLLDELPSLVGVPLADTCTLTSAKFRALKALQKPDGRVFHNKDAPQAALDAISKMGTPLSPDPSAQSKFAEQQGIDVGEAILFSALESAPETTLLTGDKRALRAVAAFEADVRSGLVGKVLIVEQVIEAALNRHGLEWLRARVCEWKKVDTSVSMIMGSRCDLSEIAVRESLESAIREMARLCDPSLLNGR